MVTPHSDDNATVTLFSKTSTQWRRAINATVAVSRFRSSLSKSATSSRQGLGAPEQLNSDFQKQNEPPSENGDVDSQASHSVEENQALDKTLKDTNPEVEVLKLIRDDLEKQLDAYGLVLVLLAGITFVAILQPPGSFNNGKLQESVLVSFFMLLATLSFFIACTGLGAVMVGCARLFRPYFYPKLRAYTDLSKFKGLLPTEDGLTTETPARRGFRKWLLGCCELGPNSVGVDDIDVLAKLCVENVYRIWRIRFYLGVALALCIAAYICGALAVVVTNDINHQRYMLVGAMAVGGAIVVCEMYISLLAMKPVSKSIDGLGQSRSQHEVLMYTFRYAEEGRRHLQTRL